MRYFICSYEIGARELIPRVALALLLSERGITSIIGHKFAVKRLLDHQNSQFKGVFTHKDGNADAKKYFESAARVGLQTVATDEELLNWYVISDPGHFASKENLGLVDIFFCSNEATLEAVRGLGFKGLLTGNLRLGLCQIFNNFDCGQQFQRKKVLINSPTGALFSINPLVAHLEISARLSSISKKWSDALESIEKTIFVELAVVREIQKICREATGKFDVTVRSHPAEHEEFFRRLANENNAKHDPAHRSSVLVAAQSDIVMAYDCSTLIEALFLRKPFLNLSSGGVGLQIDGTYAGRFLRASVDWSAITSSGTVPPVDWLSFQSLTPLFGGVDIFGNWMTALDEMIGTDIGSELDILGAPAEPIAMHPDIARRRGVLPKDDIQLLISRLAEARPSIRATLSVRSDGLVIVSPARTPHAEESF